MNESQDQFQLRMRELVAREALRDVSWMKYPERVARWKPPEVAERLTFVPLPSSSLFAHALFFAVLDPTEKPGTRTLIVVVSGALSQTIHTASDFQRFLTDMSIRPESANDAMEIAREFIYLLGFSYPQYPDAIKILSSFQDIPFPGNEQIPVEVKSLIHPAEFQQQGSNFAVHIDAWSQVGGELRCFRFLISKDEKFEVSVVLMGESLGKSWLPK